MASALNDAAALFAMPEAQQLDLLPSKFHPVDDPTEHARVRELVANDRKVGRPEGARNLTTRQTLDFVRRVMGDPLMERARMAMHTPASLAKELGCEPLDAAKFIDGIRADLSRFFYAPMAPVDGNGQAVAPIFAMQVGGNAQVAVVAPGGKPWEGAWSGYPQPEQNQRLSEPAAAVSHAPVSHENGK